MKETSQKKARDCMIPLVWYSGQDKSTEMSTGGGQGFELGGGANRGYIELFFG